FALLGRTKCFHICGTGKSRVVPSVIRGTELLTPWRSNPILLCFLCCSAQLSRATRSNLIRPPSSPPSLRPPFRRQVNEGAYDDDANSSDAFDLHLCRCARAEYPFGKSARENYSAFYATS